MKQAGFTLKGTSRSGIQSQQKFILTNEHRMNIFKPTHLYIKQHSVTGMYYFGKTTRSEKFLLENITAAASTGVTI